MGLSRLWVAALLVAAWACRSSAAVKVDEWVSEFTGSELYPSQLGEPGWPARGEGLAATGRWDLPERIPYPGSVEHVRFQPQQYVPVVPLYNAKTLVRKFGVAELAGASAMEGREYAEPIYSTPKYGPAQPSGHFNKPVPTLVWHKGSQPLRLDLGELDQGTYAVRIIAATPTDNVERMTKRLVINCTVNDGVDNADNLYRRRCAAIDEFYAIATFFFHAPERRRYAVTFTIDPSTVLPELLLHTVDLHNRLGQLAGKAGKRTASFYDAAERAAGWRENGTMKVDERPAAEKWADDERLWQACMALNGQIWGGGDDGQHDWSKFIRAAGLLVTPDMADDGMGIDFYGAEMLWKRPAAELERFLGDPKVAGMVEFTLKFAQKNPALTRHSAYPAAMGVEAAYQRPFAAIGLAKAYHESGDEVKARQAAILLARLGLQITTFDSSQALRNIDMIPILAGSSDCAFRYRFREMYYGNRGHYDSSGDNFITAYDQLFPYIKDNADLAASLGRFIPWIKNTSDMQRFYETYVLQYYAHQVMTYNAFLNDPTPGWMANVMAVQQDPQIVRPWAEWLLKYVFVYPNRPRGADELLVNAINRDGTNLRGSTCYALCGNELDTVLESFAICGAAGLEMAVDLTDRKQFPKAYWGKRFRQDMAVAGGYMFYIGDVGGPNRARLGEFSPALLKRLGGVPNNHSRVLSEWGGILETGREFDDFRQRRALGVRTGFGYGHHHSDPLDLQIWSQGVTMCGDGGARVGYCTPTVAWLGNHNTVVSDLISHGQQQWVATFAPLAGAQYLRAAVKVPGMYERQVAMIDVDDHNSYIVDVFRVKGGNVPAYAFHGMPADLFEHDALERAAAPDMVELEKFLPQESKWRGVAPPVLTATWRMRRDPARYTWVDAKGEGGKLDLVGTERSLLGRDFDEAAPRKFIRLRLLGQGGGTAYGATALSLKVNYNNDNLYVLPADWQGEAVFVAVYEPFSGEGFIEEARLLTPQAAAHGASAPVALEVTLKGGRRDLVFTSPPDSAAIEAAGVTAQGEFALLSYDTDGVRQAALVGGTKLEGEGAHLASEVAAYSGTIKSVDYRNLTIDLGEALPAAFSNAVVEVSTPGRPTNVTLNGLSGTKAALLKGLDFAMSRVAGFTEGGMPQLQGGITVIEGMTVSDDAGKVLWKIAPSASSGNLMLTDGPSPAETLKVGEALRVWEIGPGDPWRLPIHRNECRGADGNLENR